MPRTNALWLALVLSLPLSVAAAQDHDGPDAASGPVAGHAGHANHSAEPAGAAHAAPSAQGARATGGTAPAPRWPADAALTRGMARVRVVSDALAHAAHGHLDAGQMKALAAELQSAVETMYAECRLEPAPDAALHPLLARVLDAGRALSGGEFDAAAQDDLHAVLARYAELFADEASTLDQIDSARRSAAGSETMGSLQARVVSAGHLRVASSPSLEPRLGAGLEKSR